MQNFSFRGFPRAQVFSFDGLLQVAPHQVVSHTAIDRARPDGTEEQRLTLFAFDEGEGITRDIQHTDLLYFVLDGTARIFADRTPHELHAGECIVIGAQLPHAIEAVSPLRIMQLSIG